MPTLPWAFARDRGSSDAEHIVMASRLRLRSMRHVPGFLAAALRIRSQMLSSSGCIGVSLIAKPFARTFWTLSAWADQKSLDDAYADEPHRSLIDRYRPRMAGSAFVTYWGAGAAVPGWAEAKTRLRNPDSVHGTP